MDQPLANEDEVLKMLSGVMDPELGHDIVSLGMVKEVTIDDGGLVRLSIALTIAGCPLKSQIRRDVESRIGSLPGVSRIEFDWLVMTLGEKSDTMDFVRRHQAESPETSLVPPTARVLAIASGKGGVGKSSVTVNLACALAQSGLAVGLIDADIWGFSIPRMLGITDRIEATKKGDRTLMTPHRIEMGDGRLEVVSMGMLVADEESALLWRGLMLNRAVQHFLEDVRWADDLDYLLIDMPPGTGDVALGLARMLPRSELIVVTTPAKAAQKVAARAVTMARKSYLRVAGIIENMSSFTTPDGESYAIFGEGGGDELAASSGAPLLGRIPIEPAVAAGGDRGNPVALGSGPAADAFASIANLIRTEVAPPVEMGSCSARLLDSVEAALSQLDD